MSNHWRANIKDVNNLYDIDPTDLLIHIRHSYLECAKDLVGTDPDVRDEALKYAMFVDELLELQGV